MGRTRTPQNHNGQRTAVGRGIAGLAALALLTALGMTPAAGQSGRDAPARRTASAPATGVALSAEPSGQWTRGGQPPQRGGGQRRGQRGGRRGGRPRIDPNETPRVEISNLEDWRAADAQLIAAGADYMRLSGRQDELLREQQGHMRNYNREENTFASVFAMRELGRILVEWDETLAGMERVRARIWSVAEGASENREALGKILDDRLAELEKKAEERRLNRRLGEVTELNTRNPRWRESLNHRRRTGWNQHFIIVMYGENMGPLLLRRAVPPSRGGPRRGNRPDPAVNLTLEDKKAILQERIGVNERNIEIYRRWIEQRSRSIEELLAEMQKLDEEAKGQQTATPTPTPTPAPPPRETARGMERVARRWGAGPGAIRGRGVLAFRPARFAGRFDIFSIPPA